MRLAVIGGGPVGLVSGTVLASVGHHVDVVDIDTSRVERIARGIPPFHEPGLDDLLRTVVDSRALSATKNLNEVVARADVVLICVGTPSNGDGADLSALKAASAAVGRALRGAPAYRVVAVKSTVPPGTTSKIVEPILRAESGLSSESLGIAMNPEFLREGVAVEDMRQPDRIVVGVDDDRARSLMEELYRPFAAPVIALSPTGAEMTKYTSNALLATLVSFSNEIAAMCESIDGADAAQVFRALHADRRFRPPTSRPDSPSTITTYLLPGLGYGGSCFPKDTEALAVWARARGVDSLILDAVRAVNAERPKRVVDLLRSRLNLAGARVAVLGLAFKPETDDVRESRSLDLVRLLHAEGAEVRACDPVAADEAKASLNGIASVSRDADSALRGADAAVLATSWPAYVALDPAHVKSLMRRPLILDARRSLDPAKWAAHCEYLPIGVRA
jgi:UDPglucose 6-dehydrogenase